MPPAGKCIPLRHHEWRGEIISFNPLANATEHMVVLYTDAPSSEDNILIISVECPNVKN